MVKDALLQCKRRPFTTQNMPFYKPVCNYLDFRRLQSRKKFVFLCVVFLCVFIFVRMFYRRSYPCHLIFILQSLSVIIMSFLQKKAPLILADISSLCKH